MDLKTEIDFAGGVTAPAIRARWQVPVAEPQIEATVIKSEWLTWDEGEMTEVRHRKGLLLRFALLADADSQAKRLRSFRSLVKTYGPLHLCECGRPLTHGDSFRQSDERNLIKDLLPPIDKDKGKDDEQNESDEDDLDPDWDVYAKWGSLDVGDYPCFTRQLPTEPLSRWWDYSNQAASMLRLGLAEQAGTVAPSKVYEPLRELLPRSMVTTHEAGRMDRLRQRVMAGQAGAGPDSRTVASSEQREVLVAAVQEWLRMAAVRIRFVSSNGGFELVLEARTFFGALAVDLAATLADLRGVAQCAGCHKLLPGRTATQGRNSWCKKDSCMSPATW